MGREPSTPWPGTGTAGKHRGPTGHNTTRLSAIPARNSGQESKCHIVHDISNTHVYCVLPSYFKSALVERNVS